MEHKARSMNKALFCILMIAVALLGACSGKQIRAEVPQANVCDRAFLLRFVDEYLIALAAHDPSRALIAKGAKYTENEKTLPVGEGLWKNLVGLSTFKIYVPDSVVGQVGFLGVITERNPVIRRPDGTEPDIRRFPVLFGLRLKVQDRQITEIEHIVASHAAPLPACNGPIIIEGLPAEFVEEVQRGCRNSRVAAMNLNTPRPGLVAAVSVAERLTRDQMLRIANTYYDSIVQSTGNVAPYADDCVRRENGAQTTSNSPEQSVAVAALMARGNSDWAKIFTLGCRDQINTRALSYITSIEGRRVQIADPETGLVFAFSMFRRPLEERTIKIIGVPDIQNIIQDGTPSTRMWGHVFKIRSGNIHEIEAVGGLNLPLDSDSVWDGEGK